MQPNAALQIRIGLGLCLLALALVLIVALVPDPFFRQLSYVTQLDDVSGVRAGTKIDFRGATLGEVREIRLDPRTQRFTVRLAVSRNWRPGACPQVSVSAANPLTPARLSLATLDAADGRGCAAARETAGCVPIPLRPGLGGHPLTACRRAPDLIQSVAVAVTEAANVARTANAMAMRLQGLTGDGGGGGAGGGGTMMTDVAGTLAAVRGLSAQAERTLRPGQGDLAVSLGNLRRFSGNAATVDFASASAMLQEARRLVAANQASVTALLTDSAGTATQAKSTLEAASASLVRATTNLERMSVSLDALSERMAADPTSMMRGQRYVDPPPPGARK